MKRQYRAKRPVLQKEVRKLAGQNEEAKPSKVAGRNKDRRKEDAKRRAFSAEMKLQHRAQRFAPQKEVNKLARQSEEAVRRSCTQK
jgi:hypothetical protein